MYPLILKKNYQEDPMVLSAAERLLKDRRGYIFKINRKQPVVFIFSGGLDSSIAFGLVLERLKIPVYPLYIKRGAKAEKYEKTAVKHLLKFYKKKYPTLVKGIKYIRQGVPPVEIKKFIPKERLRTIGHPMRNITLQSIGIQYAVALKHQMKVDIKTIFTATSPNDTFPHSSLAALRILNISACIDNGDWGWQITSPLLEPFLWGQISKKDSIIYAKKNGIPLQKTRTCTSAKETACGICPECIARLGAFRKAGYIDPIKYERKNK